MDLYIDTHAGFCMGVRNAIETVSRELAQRKSKIYIHGDIIHNPHVIETLNKKGLEQYTDLTEVPDGSCFAIRTHGIPYEEYRNLKQSAEKIVNLCCPRVTRIQSIIKKANLSENFIIICGYKDHPEVISLQSYAHNGFAVINSSEMINALPSADHYLVISQTTFDEELFNTIREVAEKKFNQKVTIMNTICSATHDRQKHLANLLSEKNITKLVVVGGKNSSNTKRLAEIGKSRDIVTFHIEQSSELPVKAFNESDYVAVTAGASTPDSMIEDVVNRLKVISDSFKNQGSY
ncbi:MAG: 4-hydroxy-3-methylbut-2-enyl diphosphate reductase [Spirochaetes bacterium]|nr:4-hydroxy-3-methylbut-2-enyl diphosphate reductase [Spirochaetota bacterium]